MIKKNTKKVCKSSRHAMEKAAEVAEAEVYVDLPAASTPDSLASYPPTLTTDYRGELQSTPTNMMKEPAMERRKRVHLECEHRRRRQIAEGLERLRMSVLEGMPNGSKMEILVSGIRTIEYYEKKLQELNVVNLELTSCGEQSSL